MGLFDSTKPKNLIHSPPVTRTSLHNALSALAKNEIVSPILPSAPSNLLVDLEETNSAESNQIGGNNCTTFENILQNESMAPPQAPKLSFIGGDEIKKFVGNPTHYDSLFTPGPPICEFLDNFTAFCQRHNLTGEQDRLTALKCQIHPSMGDARVVLSSLLDENLNNNITFDEVTAYLKRAYKTTSSINVYRASQNFIALCKPKSHSDNDFLKLRQIEIAARELLDAFTKRTAFVNSNKSPEQKMLELLSLTAYSAYAGEKISKKLAETSVSARELLVRTTEELRLADLKEKSSPETILFAEKKPLQQSFKEGSKYNSGKKIITGGTIIQIITGGTIIQIITGGTIVQIIMGATIADRKIHIIAEVTIIGWKIVLQTAVGKIPILKLFVISVGTALIQQKRVELA